MNYLLDTCVISEFKSARPNQPLLAWLNSVSESSLYLSVLTVGEIRKGIAKLPPSLRRQALAEWLNDELVVRFSGRILAVDLDVVLAWGELTGRLQQAGRTLPAIDSLIAATALRHDCTLVTRNEADFTGTGVTVLNPWR